MAWDDDGRIYRYHQNQWTPWTSLSLQKILWRNDQEIVVQGDSLIQIDLLGQRQTLLTTSQTIADWIIRNDRIYVAMGSLIHLIDGPDLVNATRNIHHLDVSRDGRLLVYDQGPDLFVHHLVNGTTYKIPNLFLLGCVAIHLNHDGSQIAILDGTVLLVVDTVSQMVHPISTDAFEVLWLESHY